MTDKTVSIVPRVLLLSSRYDLTCDFVVSQLRQRDVKYLRINSEDLCDSTVELDPIRRRLEISRAGMHAVLTPDNLHSVLFRRPVFLSCYGDDARSAEERFSQIQWAALMRNLMLFHEARWFNNPAATYRAEQKAVQLAVAAQAGFEIPETRITNSPHPDLLLGGSKRVAIKGLDTVMIRDDGQEMFGFTTFEDAASLEPAAWRSAPTIIQAALINKLDIRVTVVEDKVFAACITVDGERITKDWRTHKGNVSFSAYDLPEEIAQRCRRLLKTLGLRFGGIDLALQEGRYYFLEVNPTGEWSWLVNSAGLPIDVAIAEALS